jgi:tRNA-specific 2-thiouridylase
VDLSAQYRERVFAGFLDGSRAGITPNPDILCNREIKFGECLQHARRLGGKVLATGHYAQLLDGGDGPELHKGIDGNKDQSYFLHGVRREAFAHALLPLGGLHKERVRELAREAGLPVAGKRDSTGICFIGERPFREFLGRFVEHSPGRILDTAGAQVGEHVGLPFYTLGQRGGIGIGGLAGSSGAPWYVVQKRTSDNVLVVVQGEDHPALYSRSVRTGPVNWLCAQPPPLDEDVAVRLRYRQPDQPATLQLDAGGSVRIEPREPQRAVTPGQYAVIYRGTRCLGGGVIVQTDI